MSPSFIYVVILIVSLLGILCSLPLPETLGLPLPQTLPEAENIGSTRPLHKWVNHWNYGKYMPEVIGELSKTTEIEELLPTCKSRDLT